ncbi:MAG: molybdopterin-dependent oxidoreductase [Gemmataceae bacterium]|jgi:NADH-quinone oxidoreductase subunit G
MATVYINDKAVDIGDKKLNLVQAAELAGVTIPHYCYHPALSVVASCRMCLVEVGEKKPDGTVVMQPRVIPACQTPAKDNTVIQTATAKSKSAQAQTLESILLNHPLDCPVCDKAGECKLQDYSYNYGNSESRMVDEKNTPPNKPDLGNNISLFTDRCIMCSRCVRFTREISGTAELHVVNRGSHAEIDVFPTEPLNNKLASNVVDLCPVGALASKDFLYTHRVWNLKTQDSVCAGCSTGCSIHLDTNKNVVYRLRPRENPNAQGYFMCDDGRLGYHYVNSSNRISKPYMKSESGTDLSSWKDILPALRADLIAVASKTPSGIAVMLSPFLTVEEGFLLATFIKSISPKSKLVLGPVPVIGEDDHYPKTRGSVAPKVKFTIRNEKCPNKKGIEQIIKHFEGDVILVSDYLSKNTPEALFIAAGYQGEEVAWFDNNLLGLFKKVKLLITQDLFPSALTDVSKYIIPSAAFSEKEGTFVNFAGLAQELHWACVPLKQVRTDGQVYLDLLERKGLLQAANIRDEIAKSIPYFSRLAGGKLESDGVHLENIA